MRARPLLIGLVVAAVVAGGGLAFAGSRGIGPLADALGTQVIQVAPQTLVLLGADGDPDVVVVRFPWPEEGFCPGQFTVPVTEADGVVRVGDVTSRWRPGADCAGVGTRDGMAGVEVRLAAPLGDRAVVRVSDGRPLPVEAPP